LRPGDDEDLVEDPEETPAARKARWAADAREAAAVRATRGAREPWGDEVQGREPLDGSGARPSRVKFDSIATTWRLRGAEKRRGGASEIPVAFFHLQTPPDPPHYGTRDAREESNGDQGFGSRERDEDHSDEREREREVRNARARARIAKRRSKAADEADDSEFGAWETDQENSSNPTLAWRGPGPRPTPVPVFAPKKKEGGRP
jgi:hypothetical protein